MTKKEDIKKSKW